MVLSKDTLQNYIDVLENIFDKVRVVDASLTKEIKIHHKCSIKNDYECYAIWDKFNRCDNCISAKALKLKESVTKFEFVDDDIYFVMSEYILLDGEECTLEMVKKLDDKTLLGAYGKEKFIKKIGNYNEKLYFDTLTGAYNRRFLSEQVKQFKHVNCIALLDIDNFKNINDTKGHIKGDQILKEVTKALKDSIKATDGVIRVGGDEFLLIFQNIKKESVQKRLLEIQDAIHTIKFNKNKDYKVSISIGSVFGEDAMNSIELADKALYEAKKKKDDYIIKYI